MYGDITCKIIRNNRLFTFIPGLFVVNTILRSDRVCVGKIGIITRSGLSVKGKLIDLSD